MHRNRSVNFPPLKKRSDVMNGYQIVHETWLTRFVSSYGDKALQVISSEIYGSGIFKLALLSCATLSLLSIAWSLQYKQFSKKGPFFFLAFTLLYPANGRPIGYITVNALGQAISGIFENAVNRIVSNAETISESSNIPPGMVLEMVTAAATSKIENPETRALIYGFVVNCLPNALTNSGEKASFDDLFDFESTFKTDSATGGQILSFKERKLDERALQNDNAYASFREGKNCFQGLSDMRTSLAHELGEKPNNITDRVIGGSREKGEEVTTEKWFKNWERASSPFKNLAMNLKMAHAASYEKSKLIAEHGWDFNDLSGNWWQGTQTDASLREMVIGMDSISAEAGYRLSDVKNLVSNVTGSRWSFTLGASIKDLKERIELVPYYVATIQLLLKILCPIFLLTLLFQTLRFFFMWSGAWIASLLFPAIISASRAIHNSIILSKLGIEKLTSTSGNNALAYGVDISQAKELLSDFVPLAYAMIEQELKVIEVLSGAILLGSWIAGGGANGFVSWISNSVQGTLTSGAVGKAASAVGGMPVARNLAIGAAVGGPVLAAGSAAFAVVNHLRQNPEIPKHFNQMFTKRGES